MILSEKSETLYRSRYGILRLMNTDVSRIFANDNVFFILALSVSLKNLIKRATTVISSVFTTGRDQFIAISFVLGVIQFVFLS
jgi:hypothetical protein